LGFKLTASILVIVMLTVNACTQAPDCSRQDVFCAALITDTRGLNDFGINQDTRAGLEQSRAEGVVNQIAYIESVDMRDYEKNIDFFVNAGYDVIVTSGIALRDVTLRNAKLNPDSVFIGMNQPDDESVPNFISVTFPEDHMGFLAGALAASLTKTKIVGAVCETSGIDAMWRYCEGFRAGAMYVDNSVKAIIAYRDNGSREKLFIDEAWGFENAQNIIRDGADVIFAVGGETGVGALRAANEAGIRTIGAERDQGAALGDQGSEVVTSILGSASITIQMLMRSVRGGNLSDAPVSPIEYVPFDAIVTKSLILKMDEIKSSLTSGRIETNVPRQKP
jgi:basic membrane protein A